MSILTAFTNIVDKAISRVTSKSSKAKGTPLIPEESPKRNSSMATPASTNPPSFSNKMYDPYTHEPSPVSGSYSQAALQHTTTILAPHHQINAYPNFQNTNYASTPYAASSNYTSSNTYHLQTAQAQVSDSCPAERLSTTDVSTLTKNRTRTRPRCWNIPPRLGILQTNISHRALSSRRGRRKRRIRTCLSMRDWLGLTGNRANLNCEVM